MPQPKYQLSYWPLPFRGCFVSYLFAYCDMPLLMECDFDSIGKLLGQPPGEQDTPFMGPPILRDLETGRTLSQMPAIVLYVSGELGLKPDDSYAEAMCMKVLMDCNDLLMEVCGYNGSIMWEPEQWSEFRSRRLVRWMQIFETSLQRGFIGKDSVSFADIAVYALFGNMTRCLPELEQDLREHAPTIHALCRRIGAQPSLASFVADEDRNYGKLYCGGQIEESLRRMLAMDAAE